MVNLAEWCVAGMGGSIQGMAPPAEEVLRRWSAVVGVSCQRSAAQGVEGLSVDVLSTDRRN